MNSYEPASVVFTRLQSLDPENASKIMGYILLQDPNEHELMRVALSPDSSLQNLIQEAKSYLRLSSNTSPAAPTSPFNSINVNHNPFSRSSPRFNGFNPSNPSSPSSSTWQSSNLGNPNNSGKASLSYAAVVNGSNSNSNLSSSGPTPSTAFYSNVNNGSSSVDLVEEYPVQDSLSFINDQSKTEDLSYDLNGSNNNIYHRRSLSLSDMGYGSGLEDNLSTGFGWRPCMYFARGHCKNGSSCNFSHVGFGDSGLDISANVGSPSKFDGFEQELLRSKAAAHRQRLAVASQLMGGSSFPYNKCANFLNDSPRSLAAGFVMGEEFNKFGRFRTERNGFLGMGMGAGATSPGSRQIYLTFPADSTFREEDVSNYFSMFGPVQDVRIPYQPKRMFGFVTFVYPETVEDILAKGNPHFVCDSRVLVKPYKEKGKVDKKQHQLQQQLLERGELSSCLSPHGSDSRETIDVHVGPRMFYNAQETLLRRKLEEHADLQRAIELQGRRMMNLQLLDLKNHSRLHNHAYQHSLPPIATISSPTQSHINQNFVSPFSIINQEISADNVAVTVAPAPQNVAVNGLSLQEGNADGHENIGSDHSNSKEETTNLSEFDLSLEHILPDNLFASPKKSATEQHAIFDSASVEEEEKPTNSSTSSSSDNTIPPSTGSLNVVPLKSCFFEMPRFSSGHEVIEM